MIITLSWVFLISFSSGYLCCADSFHFSFLFMTTCGSNWQRLTHYWYALTGHIIGFILLYLNPPFAFRTAFIFHGIYSTKCWKHHIVAVDWSAAHSWCVSHSTTLLYCSPLLAWTHCHVQELHSGDLSWLTCWKQLPEDGYTVVIKTWSETALGQVFVAWYLNNAQMHPNHHNSLKRWYKVGWIHVFKFNWNSDHTV